MTITINFVKYLLQFREFIMLIYMHISRNANVNGIIIFKTAARNNPPEESKGNNVQ